MLARPFPLARLSAIALFTAALLGLGASPAGADTVVPDDQIVQGSQCVGLDCLNNENFLFSTQIMKENNVRTLFNDTSTSPGFATENWGLVANASSSGGSEFFGIADLGPDGTDTTNPSVMPFWIAGGAPNNAMVVAPSGKVGLGTASPALNLHIASGNTPAIRLEQSDGSGFPPQTWDVAGNESNFFVRDVTGGSKLPFRIRPGAPTSSVDVAASGNVGIGTSSPAAPLDIRRADGSAQLKIDEVNTTVARRDLIQLENNGPSAINFVDTSAAGVPAWNLGPDASAGGDFVLASPGAPLAPLRVSAAGDLSSGAALQQNGDATSQDSVQALSPADSTELLDKVASLPLRSWLFTGDAAGGRHLGPTAADFNTTFGLGSGSTYVAPGDMGGVALASIQALKAKIDDLGSAGVEDLKTTQKAQGEAIDGLTSEQRNQSTNLQAQSATITNLRKQNKNFKKRIRRLERMAFKR